MKKQFVCLNIAVVGTGSVVEGYILRYAGVGHEIFAAWKEDCGISVNMGLLALPNVHFCSIEQAAMVADIIVIACAPKDVREIAYWMGDVRGKIIIDATANMRTEDDKQLKTVCAIKAITASGHIVKVFNTRGYEQLLMPIFKDEHVRLVLVGDKKTKEVAKLFTIELGVNRFFDMGGEEAIPLFNEMTRGWWQLKQATLPIKYRQSKLTP